MTKTGATDGTGGPVQVPVVPAGWTRYEKAAFSVYSQDSLGKPESDDETSPAAGLVAQKIDGKRRRALEVTVAPMSPAAFAANVGNLDAAYRIGEIQDERRQRIRPRRLRSRTNVYLRSPGGGLG